jgi:hypothetical protein
MDVGRRHAATLERWIWPSFKVPRAVLETLGQRLD